MPSISTIFFIFFAVLTQSFHNTEMYDFNCRSTYRRLNVNATAYQPGPNVPTHKGPMYNNGGSQHTTTTTAVAGEKHSSATTTYHLRDPVHDIGSPQHNLTTNHVAGDQNPKANTMYFGPLSQSTSALMTNIT